jgi:AraC-like DNA-binding protein
MRTGDFDADFIMVAPSDRLRRFVSHYWLSRNNSESTYVALPDGSVDIVIEASSVAARSWVYGSTTARTEIPLVTNVDYLGVRFAPGQSRHFIRAAARELTDAHESTHGLLAFSLDAVSSALTDDRVFSRIDSLIESHLSAVLPTDSSIDRIIRRIGMMHGTERIEEIASLAGWSRRHLERVFLETVGVSAKFFSMIARANFAQGLLRSSMHPSLAQVAIDAGYADQSHMSRDFRRLTGQSPCAIAEADVAFIQDAPE